MARKGEGVAGRTGVTWRDPNYVVEMRLPKKIAQMKLHFGTYKTLTEAMVARDFGAYLRNSTGKEDRAAVGGFRNPDVHPSIFEFEESPEVFESLEGSRAQARRDEYKRLLALSTTEGPRREACISFCEAAREDIGVAIESFRRRDPQMFLRPPPSSSEVRVSPTPERKVGANMGEGSTSFIGALSLEIQITLNGSPFQTQLQMNVPLLSAEEIFMITKAGIDRIQRELIDKWLEELGPCPIEPETILALE